MRSILSICFLVLLPWKLNGDTTLSPSVSNQNEDTSEGQGPSTRGEGTSNVSINTHEEHTTDLRPPNGVFSTKLHSQFTQDQHNTGASHEKHKAANMQMTTEERESFLHSSSLATVKKQTKRSLEVTQNNQTTSTRAIPVNVTMGQEHQISHELNSTNKNGVTDKHEETLRSSEKILNPQSNSTSHFPTTPVVITNEPGKVNAIPQTNMQTKWSTQVQENNGTKASTAGTPILHATNSSTALVTTSKDRINTVPAISNSSMEVTLTVNSFTTSRSSSIGNISTVPIETVPTATPTKDIKTTRKKVTRGTTTTRPASTTRPMTTLTKTQTTEPKPKTPKNNKTKEIKKHHAGPIVAAIIGSVMVLMFIAILAILVRKRRMQKKQHENTDWAGPSPFLEGDAQSNQAGHGGDGLFQRRDTKRISLHSFFPLRASQRLSLLMEEEVQMNDIAVSSTFGRNEQPQNGKPAVENDQIQTPTTDNQDPAPEDSSGSTVPETGTATAIPVDSVNIQNPESDETVPSSSSETKATPPPSPSFEEVKLNPTQTNAVHIPPAPPLP